MGSLMLYLDVLYLDVMIVDCNFYGNLQDKCFYYIWIIFFIFFVYLKFILIRFNFFENIGRFIIVYNDILVGKLVNFFVSVVYKVNIIIIDLLYINNSGGGMFFKLGLDEVSNLIFFLVQLIFESN